MEPIALFSVADLGVCARALRARDPGAHLHGWKIDMSAAYRQFMLRRNERWAMGFEWPPGVFWAHECIIWGAKGSAHAVCLFTAAVCDLMAAKGFRVWSFIDDFVGLEASAEAAWAAVRALRALFAELGIDENVAKFCAPSPQLTALGVAMDFAAYTMGVTDARAARLVAALEAALAATPGRVPIRDAQRLVGKLGFVQPLFPLSRPFLFSLWRWLAEAPQGAALPVGVEVAMSLSWWRAALGVPPASRAASMLGGTVAPLQLLLGVTSDASDWG
jgi:hypothetical protein